MDLNSFHWQFGSKPPSSCIMNSLQALEAGVYLLNILHRLVNQNRFFSGQVLRPRSAALQLVGMLLPWAQSDARYGPSMVHQASAAVTASQLVCIYIYKYIYTILHYFMLQYYILRQIYIYIATTLPLSLSPILGALPFGLDSGFLFLVLCFPFLLA